MLQQERVDETVAETHPLQQGQLRRVVEERLGPGRQVAAARQLPPQQKMLRPVESAGTEECHQPATRAEHGHPGHRLPRHQAARVQNHEASNSTSAGMKMTPATERNASTGTRSQNQTPDRWGRAGSIKVEPKPP